MEDMCQLTEHLTERKYKSSYEQIAKAIRKYSAAPGLDLTKFWTIVMFSWVVGNSDMHLKNFSLYAPNETDYILTPAYDLLNTLLVIPEDAEELALTLNGKKSRLTRHDFELAMLSSGLNEKVISNIFNRFKRITSQWESCIRSSFLPQHLQDTYWSLIQQRIALL
jgi:serine/threonine-protein kinase HipA